ncbi:ribonuclease H-like domain-containing protein [Tanacetum coccineum]|uniref:Ribonuclease H-like domain-containing protein n=1 Tax=Tanacetum coccineum TaxID=301880 RepID=A0ABQ5EDK8_9ASTR
MISTNLLSAKRRHGTPSKPSFQENIKDTVTLLTGFLDSSNLLLICDSTRSPSIQSSTPCTLKSFWGWTAKRMFSAPRLGHLGSEVLRFYATEVLDRAGMLNCKPCRTPVDTDSKLSADGAPISDSTLYRSLDGALTVSQPLTRP